MLPMVLQSKNTVSCHLDILKALAEDVLCNVVGAPAVAYEEPVDSYGAPAASYDAPAPSYDAPVADEYGSPAAPVVADSYGMPTLHRLLKQR